MDDDLDPANRHLLDSMRQLGMTTADVSKTMRDLTKAFELARPMLKMPVYDAPSDAPQPYVIQEEP